MSADPVWPDSTRWNLNQHSHGQYHQGKPQAIQPFEPSPAHASMAPTPLTDSCAPIRPVKSQPYPEAELQTPSGPHGRLLHASESYTGAWAYPGRPIPRHSSPANGNHDGPPQLTTPSPYHAGSAFWRSLPPDHHRSGTSERRMADAPLTLQIPSNDHGSTPDLPRLATTRNLTPHDGISHGLGHSAITPQQTSLPSFAHFQESAARSDASDELENATMSSRLSCYMCTKLKPMVSDVATRLVELDECIQAMRNRSAPRVPSFPQDSPVRAMQWILNRLEETKMDLLEASRRQPLSYMSSQAVAGYGSPQGSLKRSADRWDEPSMKRQRSSEIPEDFTRLAPSLSVREERRPSVDFSLIPRESLQRPGFSPPASESVPGSAYPRTNSPGMSSRQPRALPSPLSTTCPPSAAPSLAPATTKSADSPINSYRTGSSLHNASTNPATSAHIADLQHQVTLKSLALQTLQTEYASLLQKLQRERVKSQTIEKKTSVADQEVNELTNKNEELTDQVKSLQKNLEESEKKRDEAYAEAKREKDQWGRMLEMSGRLQNKHAEEKQKLVEENAKLSLQVTAAGQGSNLGGNWSRETHTPNLAEVSNGTFARDIMHLKHENDFLQTQINALRQALEEAKSHNDSFLTRVQEQSSRLGIALDGTTTQESQALYAPGSTEISSHYEAKQSQPDSSTLQTSNVRPNSSSLSLITPVTSQNSAPPPNSNSNMSPPIVIPKSSTTSADAPPTTLTRPQYPSPGSSTNSQYHLDRNSVFERSLSQNDIKTEAPPPAYSDAVDKRFCSFRPLNILSSPYTDGPRAVSRSDGSPHSYHSSPGPYLDGSSPSNSAESPEVPSTTFHPRPRDEKLSSAQVNGIFGGAPYLDRSFVLQHAPTQRNGWGVLAMPPPPRPA